ncbi:hypothetical protein [Streptomyces sp. NPDC093094]|uniref:hypothetical protein n=1 Tax=Streptomyces sp. NPDC093094 TaxID=3366026 RepID=UPI0037F20971
MAQLKPVSLDVLAEARDEVDLVVARLMARLTPGEHVVRLTVGMDDFDEVLSADLPVTVEGEAGADALVRVERKDFDNFVFLLTVGLAQTLSWGSMSLHSPANTIKAWCLEYGALAECDAAYAEVLVGDGEPASFEVAFSVHTDEEDDEAIYPPVAYKIP